MFQRRFFFLLIIGILSISSMQAQPVKEISVKINQKLNPVPAAMWGIFSKISILLPMAGFMPSWSRTALSVLTIR